MPGEFLITLQSAAEINRDNEFDTGIDVDQLIDECIPASFRWRIAVPRRVDTIAVIVT